jgi:hypothetical protein
MSSNWIPPLEICAAGGVLDYDAAADILDLPPRFVGHPEYFDIPVMDRPLLLPPGTKIKGELKEDSFGAPSSLVRNPSWKKWLFGGLVASGVLALVFRKKLSLPKLSSLKMPAFSQIGTTVKNFAKTLWSYVKKPFEFISKKFKP